MFKAAITNQPDATFDFQYDSSNGRRTTTCILSVGDRVLSKASCTVDSRDRFVKERGRKTALKKLLKPYDRSDRLNTWKNYFDRTGQVEILRAIEKKEGY